MKHHPSIFVISVLAFMLGTMATSLKMQAAGAVVFVVGSWFYIRHPSTS